jgi:hypothetical protein
MRTGLFFLYISTLAISCEVNRKDKSISTNVQILNDSLTNSFDSSQKTIHVFVALCDNKYQGIVPVPPKIGNGQDPDNNLYWGCGYGIRSYFKKSKNWKLVKKYSIDSIIMERLVFKHTKFNYYLIADAYNGKEIKKCTVDFLSSCAGIKKETLEINNSTIGISGNSNLVSYIGHDGLMDFQISEKFINKDGKVRNAIILACISKKYFGPHLAITKANPLVWSTGLMSPEAYTLHDALESYINNDTPLAISISAAKAYSKYQKCSEKAARRLLVSGY